MSTNMFRIIKESYGESSQRTVSQTPYLWLLCRAHCGTKSSQRTYNSYYQDIAIYAIYAHNTYTIYVVFNNNSWHAN